MKKIALAIFAIFLLNGCIEVNGDTVTDSNNDNSITDSYNEYTQAEEDIIKDGYVPDEEGVCKDGYFWCSIEEKCLPASDGASCPVGHTDEEEAEQQEINEGESL